MNHCIKSWLYNLGSALLMGLSAIYQVGLHDPAGPEEGYFALHRVMLILSFVLVGAAVFAYMSHPKETPQHRADRLLLLLTGLVMLVMTLVIWVGFGGVEAPFDEAGYLAVNLQIVTMTALPLPFLIRGWVLAFSHDIEEKGQARAAKLVALAAGMLLVVLIATGGLFRMMTYSPVL